jgi:glycosyltransferase involved in cell wall biosynthesis
MRVLQVIDSLPLAGAEVLVKDMAPRFRKRGIDCDVAVLRKIGSPLESELQACGVALHSTNVTHLYSPRQVLPLAKLMQGYDIIHVHLFPAQLWAIVAAKRLRTRIPLVTTEHNTWNARRRWWLRPFDTWMYPHYKCIACNSQATAEELIRWVPKTARRIRVIPNGIPLESFESAAPAELPALPPDMLRAVFVGRFEPQKDHLTLLRAVAQVSSLHLLLVGDGPLRPQLEGQTRSLGIHDRVTFLGKRTDVSSILKASDIYVHSTTSDGFGIAACEAMAAGLPVVASDVPGLAQVIEGAGVRFPIGDDKALAHELLALVSSPERRREMGQASRQRARAFNIEATVDTYLELYRQVLEAQALEVECSK